VTEREEKEMRDLKMRTALAIAATSLTITDALYTQPPSLLGRRRAIALAGGSALPALLGGNQPATAASEETVKIYFGAGCFWHVQHEFTMEEVGTLKRSPAQITAVTGYAGGNRLGDGGKVCYHNFQRLADYGQLGHAEAVQVEVPVSALPQFSKRYFDLFGTRGYRHDPQDKGGEYRSVLGLPGGDESPYFEVIREAASNSPMKLFKGRGDEPDTIGDRAVLVYDSKKFPFYAAEVYHQFHDDFMGAPYGKSYNALRDTLYKANVLASTGCPDMTL